MTITKKELKNVIVELRKNKIGVLKVTEIKNGYDLLVTNIDSSKRFHIILNESTIKILNNINRWDIVELVNNMEVEKVEKAQSRNNHFTSSYYIESMDKMFITSKGIYIKLKGTRCNVALMIGWDGEILKRLQGTKIKIF